MTTLGASVWANRSRTSARKDVPNGAPEGGRRPSSRVNAVMITGSATQAMTAAMIQTGARRARLPVPKRLYHPSSAIAGASTNQGDQNINPRAKTLAIGMRGAWLPIDIESCSTVMRTVSSTVAAIATPIAISTCEPSRADEAAGTTPDAVPAFTVAMGFQLNDRARHRHFLRVSDQILRVAPDSLPGSAHRHSVEPARRSRSAAYASPFHRRDFVLRFGNVGLKQEESRETWMTRFVSELGQDVRYGLRTLVKQPTLTIVAVLTLALGVGANTAIFSIVDAVLLRYLPYRNPDRLVRVFFNEPGVGLTDVRFSEPELEDLQKRSGVFDDVTPIFEGNEDVIGDGPPERVEGVNGSFSYFSLLGVKPQVGRLFGPADFVPGFAYTVVISDGLWHRAYGGDPHIVGRTLRLDNDPMTIIGVLPPGFRHPGPTVSGDVEVFGAAGFTGEPFPKPARSTRVFVNAIGRLKPGLTLAQAQTRLTTMAAELRHAYPGDYPTKTQWTIEIQSLQEMLVGNVRPMLLVLLGSVILIVLIVSLNIANLLLARASGRQQEMAVRQSLGASRGRLVRQTLTEAMLLSLIGGVAGIATAAGTLRFIVRFVPSNLPRLNEVRIDWVVLAFALLLSVLTGLVFGLAPALHSAKTALSSAIREGGRG